MQIWPKSSFLTVSLMTCPVGRSTSQELCSEIARSWLLTAEDHIIEAQKTPLRRSWWRGSKIFYDFMLFNFFNETCSFCLFIPKKPPRARPLWFYFGVTFYVTLLVFPKMHHIIAAMEQAGRLENNWIFWPFSWFCIVSLCKVFWTLLEYPRSYQLRRSLMQLNVSQ